MSPKYQDDAIAELQSRLLLQQELAEVTAADQRRAKVAAEAEISELQAIRRALKGVHKEIYNYFPGVCPKNVIFDVFLNIFVFFKSLPPLIPRIPEALGDVPEPPRTLGDSQNR